VDLTVAIYARDSAEHKYDFDMRVLAEYMGRIEFVLHERPIRRTAFFEISELTDCMFAKRLGGGGIRCRAPLSRHRISR
jgi:hypothetical protein